MLYVLLSSRVRSIEFTRLVFGLCMQGSCLVIQQLYFTQYCMDLTKKTVKHKQEISPLFHSIKPFIDILKNKMTKSLCG